MASETIETFCARCSRQMVVLPDHPTYANEWRCEPCIDVARLQAAMLEILRWSAWQVRLNDWRQHRVTAVGTQPTPDDACREIRAIARQALHDIGTEAKE